MNKLTVYINVLTRHLLVLQLTVYKKETAYTIFETLNKRGKDLSESDMIKNELFKSFNNSQRGNIKDMWDKICDNLETENLTEYIRFHYSSQYKNVTPAKLYEVIKSHIHTSDPMNYLSTLVIESEWFARITLIDSSFWDNETIELLKSFQTLDVSHCYPLILSGAIVFANDLTSFKRLLRNTVNFCFRYFTISRNSVSDLENEIGFMARFIRNLGSTIKHNKTEYTFYNLDDITDYMKTLSTDSVFESKFSQYSTKTNSIAFYILFNLEKHLKSGVVPLPHGPSQHVEHIMPKTPSRAIKRATEWSHVKDDPNYKEYVFRLGNLLILESDINQKIKNKDYDFKKVHYNNSGLYYPTQVSKNFPTWNFTDIENRQYQMSKIALEVWKYI